jgi:PPOX class probable F420-dependent enzyme
VSPVIAPAQARRLLADARVARLATVNPGLGIDVVPITFALLGAGGGEPDRLVTAVDHKPKSTTRLRRLRNITEHPDVTVLVDHYENDWDRLWWVRLRGRAEVVSEDPARGEAVDALVDRYEQYRELRPEGPAIVIAVDEWTGWRADAT